MDFGSLSKSSNMKRKQSSVRTLFQQPPNNQPMPSSNAQSLLAALGKSSSQRSPVIYPPSAYAAPGGSAGSYAPSIASSDDSHDTTGFYSPPESTSSGPTRGVRSVSASTTGSMYTRSNASATPRAIRRVEDMYHLVRDRLTAWSYLMQFYNGDLPWLNCVHVGRASLESALGSKQLDTLARQEYALGLSLAALFDISGAGDFLRAINKLFDEWESWTETGGTKGNYAAPIRSFFRPQRTKPRPSAAQATATAEVTIAQVDASSESFLILAVMPFTPDYFQVHASTCSIVRDVYKKLLAMVLPATRGGRSMDLGGSTLLHPSTLVLLGPNDGNGQASEIVSDAALLGSAEMPSHLTLVGEGQKLTPQVIELLLRVDARLKKHYAALLHDGDTIARKVLDDQIAAVTASLGGEPPMQYAPPTPTAWTEAL